MGIPVSDQAHDWDDRTRKRLCEKNDGIAAAINDRKIDRWATDDGGFRFDSSAPIDPSDVFGLDTTLVPEKLKVKIPTVHIFGSKDPRYPASLQLSMLCDATKRRTYDHGGGHDIPRNKMVSEDIARLMEWVRGMAMHGERIGDVL